MLTSKSPPAALALSVLAAAAALSCGPDDDACVRAREKLDACPTQGSLIVPLNVGEWKNGCPSKFDRCAAQCVLKVPCEQVFGASSTDPSYTGPRFGACLEQCNPP